MLTCVLIRGDTAAIEQFAYEFCEDEAKQKVAYCELRYSPHYLAELKPRDGLPYVSAETVVRCVNNGLRRGCHEFGVKIRTILCCMTDHPGMFTYCNLKNLLLVFIAIIFIFYLYIN